MIRRKLLTGAAAMAAYGLLPKGARGQNQVITAPGLNSTQVRNLDKQAARLQSAPGETP